MGCLVPRVLAAPPVVSFLGWATRFFRPAPSSSSLECRALAGFAFFIGRWGDDSESEVDSTGGFENPGGVWVLRGCWGAVTSEMIVFEGPATFSRDPGLPMFIGSSASDSVAESDWSGFVVGVTLLSRLSECLSGTELCHRSLTK